MKLSYIYFSVWLIITASAQLDGIAQQEIDQSSLLAGEPDVVENLDVAEQVESRAFEEQELKAQELKEQELKEQELKEQELKEQELKEQELEEQELMAQELKEQELKAQELKEQLLEDEDEAQLPEYEEEKKDFEEQSSSTAEDSRARTSRHTNNWAVLVSTSRFWFNYRHMANVLSMYRTVKRLGIPDSQIILMLSDDVSCNPRNAFPGAVFNNADRGLDLYGDNIEVDYRGYEVTVENFIRLLTDRWDQDTPRSKRLLTDDRSNIFIYMTGHGGNEFLKFQDADEIGAQDIADAFEQMWEKHRYNEIFFMIDTCQANTMHSKFYSPNILAVGSSDLDENSYSHHSDLDVGVAVIDRFTYYNLEFLEQINKTSQKTLKDLFESYTFDNIHSNPGIKSTAFGRPLDEVLITDFFGNIQNVYLDHQENDLLELASLSKDTYESETNHSNWKEESTAAADVVKSEVKQLTLLESLGSFKLGELNGHSSSTAGLAIAIGVGFSVLSWFL